MRKKIIPLVFLFATFISFSQRSKLNIDSIYKTIPSAPDTSKCKKLNLIARAIIYNYPDSALFLADSSKRLAKRIGFKKGIAYADFLLGFAWQGKGKYDLAINAFDESLVLYEKLNMKDDIANMYNSLANIYMIIGNFEVAEKNYQKCNEYAGKEPKSKYYLAIGSVGLAHIKSNKKLYHESLDLNLQGLKYFRELGFTDYATMAMQNVSENYVELKNFKMAALYNDTIIQRDEEINDLYGLTNAYSTRSKILKDAGDAKGALAFAIKAYDKALEMNTIPELAEKSKSVYEFYKENKDYKNALEMLEKFLSYNDSLRNKESSEAIADAEAKFDTKQKEQDLKLAGAELEKSELKLHQRNRLIFVFIGASLLFLILLFLVYRQFSEKKKANRLLTDKNEEIEKQKLLIEEKNRDITDSIVYSRHIQQAIIPSQAKMQNLLPQSFVMFKPKDIVSGDFYLVEEVVGLIYLAAIDCTGHGVPGAMLSVFADSTIKNSIASNQFRNNPGALLSDLCFQFKSNLHSNNANVSISDGVDMALCIIDKNEKKIYFSGARNGLLLINKDGMKEFSSSRWGISGTNKGEQMFYPDHEISYNPGDWFYLYTDGFADQFGGPKGKKYKQKQLQAMLKDNMHLPPQEQKAILESAFSEWKGGLEQIDDITVIGFTL